MFTSYSKSPSKSSSTSKRLVISISNEKELFFTSSLKYLLENLLLNLLLFSTYLLPSILLEDIIILTPSSSILISTLSNIDIIRESISLFFRRKDRRENPLEYLKVINFDIDKKYTSNKVLLAKKIIFYFYI